jgi:23S rRNA pseudouridine2604 synthase
MTTTLKLKKRPEPAGDKLAPPRAPVRGLGAGVKKRPTLAEAQAYRAERAARQERVEQAERAQHPGPAARTRPPERARTSEGTRRAEAPRPDKRTRPSGPADPRFSREAPRREATHDAPRSSARHAPRPGGRPHAAAFEPRQPRREPPAASRGDRSGRPERPHQPNTAFSPRADTRREPPSPRHAPAVPRQESPAGDYVPVQHAPGSLRLSKRMSELGLASRREADEWIAKGWVRVDDQVVSELGSRVLPEQRITVDAKARHEQAQRVTVLINKPVGYVSGQAEDGYEPAFVLVTPGTLWAEDHSGTRFMREHLKSLVPAGRLDIDSVGLLVLTQDGRVAKQLIGEDSEVDKEYLVRVAMADGATLPESGLALLRHGLELDGEALREAQVEWVNADQLRFVLRQGKKRQIRRMCEAVGLQVLGLKRVRIGKVMLGDLPTGQWRYLRADESFV